MRQENQWDKYVTSAIDIDPHHVNLGSIELQGFVESVSGIKDTFGECACDTGGEGSGSPTMIRTTDIDDQVYEVI